MLGMDERCSRLSLYLRMTGVLDDDRDNEAMLQGRFYERATADIACYKYGMKIVEGFEQIDLQHDNLSGHPDFVAIDEHNKLVILEVKNPFHGMMGLEWGEAGSDDVPRPYYIQSTVYGDLFKRYCESNPGAFDKQLEVADYVYVIARLFGGVVRYKVPIDSDIIEKVQEESRMFLSRIARCDPPSPEDEEDHRNSWPVETGKAVDCNESFMAQLTNLQRLKDQIKELTRQESEIKTLVLAYARDAERIEFVDQNGVRSTVVTLSASRKFDEARCLAENPDLLSQYAKLDTTRLGKEKKGLYESYMRKPETAVEQTRTIRLKLPKEKV